LKLANETKSLGQLPQVLSMNSNDYVVILGNSGANAAIINSINFQKSLNIITNVPANSSANGITNTIAYDANYIYVCVANNTWKRTALSSW
jgi:hypothetical protein